MVLWEHKESTVMNQIPTKTSHFLPSCCRRSITRTSVQQTCVAVALEGSRQEIPCQRMPLCTFEAEPPSDKCRVSCVQFPYGDVLRRGRHESYQEAYFPFA